MFANRGGSRAGAEGAYAAVWPRVALKTGTEKPPEEQMWN